MKTLLPLVLGLLVAAEATAQRSGSINRRYSTFAQTMTAGDTKISLDYNAIAWGQGKTFKDAMDKAAGADARKAINDSAKANPAGKFTTSVDVTCGELKIAAGEYVLSFTISDNCEWQINFTGKETLTMKLPLIDNKDQPHKRLVCSLYAGDDAGSAGCYIGFGEKMAMLTFKPNAPAGAKKG